MERFFQLFFQMWPCKKYVAVEDPASGDQKNRQKSAEKPPMELMYHHHLAGGGGGGGGPAHMQKRMFKNGTNFPPNNSANMRMRSGEREPQQTFVSVGKWLISKLIN